MKLDTAQRVCLPLDVYMYVCMHVCVSPLCVEHSVWRCVLYFYPAKPGNLASLMHCIHATVDTQREQQWNDDVVFTLQKTDQQGISVSLQGKQISIRPWQEIPQVCICLYVWGLGLNLTLDARRPLCLHKISVKIFCAVFSWVPAISIRSKSFPHQIRHINYWPVRVA